ncbi:MAG: acyl transferase [Bacteroidota bacterium]
MQTPLRHELLTIIAAQGLTDEVVRKLFCYQRDNNPLYGRFVELLGDKKISPFLPVSFFKSHEIKTGDWSAETWFESSGTTGQTSSVHLVRDLNWYLTNAERGFSGFYDHPRKWCILGLLPNYLERGHSSLVAMVNYMTELSEHPESGFFLNDFERLRDTLIRCRKEGVSVLLLGVTYALLDFAERYPMNLQGVTVMETGGMKGRRKEMTRTEVHQVLMEAFGVDCIHSEYGMTELFSQAYARGGTIFAPANTMKVVATEINDPFCTVPLGKTGVLNIIDLANLDTVSFIQTEDIGRVHPDGSFEVLGRLDAAELRGCNLMVE